MQNRFVLPKIENGAFSPFAGVVFYPILLNSFSLTVTVRDGVAWEDDSGFGWAHFLEHANFQKTDRYASFLEIASLAESLGARISAFTTRDCVTYSIHAPSWSLEESFRIMTSLISHLNFEDDILDSEKEIIFQEMEREKANFRSYYVLFSESELLSPSMLGRYSLGSRESLLSINSANIADYKRRVYSRENICLTLCGGFDLETAQNLTGIFLESLPSAKVRLLQDYNPAKISERRRLYHCPSAANQVQMITYFRFPAVAYYDWLKASLVNTLLGVGFSSLFYKKLRHEQKLTYTTATQLKLYPVAGTFRLVLDLDPKSASFAENLIYNVIAELDDISENDFVLAKNKFWGDIAFKLSDMNSYGLFAARRQFMGEERLLLSNLYEELKNMSREELSAFAVKNFIRDNSIVCFAGSDEALNTVSKQ